MGMFNEVKLEETTLEELMEWAEENQVYWVKIQSDRNPFRAAKLIGTDHRMLGVGKTLKDALWMAMKMLPELCKNEHHD